MLWLNHLKKIKMETLLVLKAERSSFISIYPHDLHKLMEFVKENYQSPKVYITKNRITEAKNDTSGLEEALKDPQSRKYSSTLDPVGG